MATIPPNNTSGLYGIDSAAIPISNNVLANNISATGNVTVDGFVLANGSITTNSNFVGNLVGNVSASVVSATGNITGQYFIGNGSQLTGITTGYGNSNVVNLMANFGANTVSTTGNIAGGYILGNGSQLTGLPQSYSNANVTTLLAAFGSNTISTSGNITGGYILGNGSQLTGLPATYGNSNVAAYLPTYSGNLNPNTISATGNITGGNLQTSGAFGNIVGANYVSASYFVGDGGLLTNVTATSSYANSNVTNLLANFGSNTISTTGNIYTGNILTNGYYYANGAPFSGGGGSTYGNANVNTLLAAWGSNTLSTTGNVTAGYLVGNGSLLSNLTGANVSGTVANATYATSAGSATTATTATQANYANTANAVAGGNVSGQVANALVAGTVYTAAQPNITTVGTLTSLSSSGNITASYFLGNGSQLTGLPATYGNSNVATFLASFGSNTISTTGNVSVGNLTVAGTETDTGNITGGNLLTGGLISATGNVTGNYILGNIANATGTAPLANVSSLVNVSNANGSSVSAFYVTYASGYGPNQVQIDQTGSGMTYTPSTAQLYLGIVTAVGNVSGGNLLTAGLISSTGNATHGNILTNGQVSATGNITGNQVTAIGNVSGGNLLTAGLISSTGNVIAGNVTTAGQVTATGNVSGGNILTAGTVSAIGSATAGSFNTTGQVSGGYVISGVVTVANTDGSAGQVLTTYGNGRTYFSTVAGGSANAGGANTQIQYNNANAFAGNSAMTFDQTTGNITMGNIVTNVNSIQTVAAIDQANIANIFASSIPSRIIVGNAYFGSANTIYAGAGAAATSGLISERLLVADFINVSNNGIRALENGTILWANLTANISNTTSRITSTSSELVVGGGTNNYNITSNNINNIIGTRSFVYLGRGTNANLSLVGNTVNSGGLWALAGTCQIQAGSSTQIAGGLVLSLNPQDGAGNLSLYGNAIQMVGTYVSSSTNLSNTSIAPTSLYTSYYHPGLSSAYTSGSTMGNTARQAASYYSFRSDDTLARAQLGSLSSFNELDANITSLGGSLTVNKSTAQVQQIYLTENITSVAFTGFVTRVQKPDTTYANQTDTVTLIIKQGATPYTVTLPVGNTQVKYAAGVSTVGSSANGTTMISITGTYDYNTAANCYLVTVSPEFS